MTDVVELFLMLRRDCTEENAEAMLSSPEGRRIGTAISTWFAVARLLPEPPTCLACDKPLNAEGSEHKGPAAFFVLWLDGFGQVAGMCDTCGAGEREVVMACGLPKIKSLFPNAEVVVETEGPRTLQ